MVNDRVEGIRITLEDVEGGIVVVRLSGYLDTNNTGDFLARIMKVVESGHVRLILDCGELAYVSSMGIGAFTSIFKSAKAAGGEALLINVQPKVMEVFHLLGFTMAFLMKESLTEAVGYFRSGGTGKSEKGSPLVFSCPICFKKLKASKTGKFRCPFCGNILAIGDDGEIALA